MIGSPRDTVAASKARKDAVGRAFGQEHRVRVTPEGVRHQKDTINTQRKEITRLNREVIQRGKQILGLNKRLEKEKERSESIRETARELSRESLRLHRETRILRDCGARARSLSEEVRWLRFAVDGAQAQNAALKAKLATRIAEKNTRSRPIAGVHVAYRAQEIPAAEGDDQVPVPGDPPSAQSCAGVGATQAPGSQATRGSHRGVEVSVGPGRGTAQGAAEIATPEGHHQVAARGQRPAAQGREDVAEPGRDAGGRACEASRHRGGALEDALRAQEREAGDAAHRAPARPAAWRPRPWPHPAARARGTHRRAQSAH